MSAYEEKLEEEIRRLVPLARARAATEERESPLWEAIFDAEDILLGDRDISSRDARLEKLHRIRDQLRS